MNTFMKIFALSFALFVTACGQSSIEGEYKGDGGKVGIYKMNTLLVEKDKASGKYSVQFVGDEKTLSYKDVELKGSTLEINDKGFVMPVKIEGNKTTVQESGAVFERASK